MSVPSHYCILTKSFQQAIKEHRLILKLRRGTRDHRAAVAAKKIRLAAGLVEAMREVTIR